MTTTQIAILALVLFAAGLGFLILRGRRSSAPTPPSPAEIAAENERLRAEREAASVPVIKPKRPR